MSYDKPAFSQSRMSHSSPFTGIAPEMLLKTMPPRPPHRALARPRLGLDGPCFAGYPIVLLQAGAGWGKSALLVQWRHDALQAGRIVAWLSVDGDDDPQRLAHGLALALRRGCGDARRTLARPGPGAIEAATAWLAEAASLQHDVLVLIDDLERLPPEGAGLLRYVLYNLPPNVRLAGAGRAGLEALAAGLPGAGQYVLAGPSLLRFSVGEACSLATDAGSSADDGARLHEATEGWPLGLQLALRARARAAPAPDHERFMANLLDELAPQDRDFLMQVAICDTLHPALCEAVVDSREARARLARLVAETPLFTEAETGDWSRLHTMARDLLRQRLQAWPAERRRRLHARALSWLAGHGMLHEAARHAHAAGLTDQAWDLAERSLLELVREGRLDALAGWRALLPDAELEHRPRLRLAIAWSHALSEHPERATELVGTLLAGANGDPALEYECALISCAALAYADAPDRLDALFAPWTGQAPATADRWLRQAHANRCAALALVHGQPAQARRHLPAADVAADGSYVARWGQLLRGLSYMWQGQARLAAETLRHVLASTDTVLGRRHPLAAMVAAVFAAAEFEAGHIDEARLLLANRLDVLERGALPDILLLGYTTAARIAAAQGQEHRALDLCDALFAAGEHRRLPRIRMAALGEQIRLHAARQRPDTCRRLLAQLEAELLAAGNPGPLWQRQAELLRWLAAGRVAFAAADWHGALAALDQAGALAAALQRGQDALEIMTLRALALERLGQDSAAILDEAAGLARTYGLAHAPGISAPQPEPGAAATAPSLPAPRTAVTGHVRVTVAGAALLTPKEGEVLELLARKLSNKEIAHVLAVGEETVKWHLKNLFGKLEAASRRHAVSRAVLLGLME
jgi:LuxR family maltose regulon positive regulatory protein